MTKAFKNAIQTFMDNSERNVLMEVTNCTGLQHFLYKNTAEKNYITVRTL